MGYRIIGVPAMAGDPEHAASHGPAVLGKALAQSHCRRAVRQVQVPPFCGQMRPASLEVNRRLAIVIREVVAEGDVPVVLAGSCDVAAGVLAGIRDDGVGVVWIDAHADFNTPASSISGFWPGMSLAVVVGDCGDEIWSELAWRGVAEERVALFGVRSLSPAAEVDRLTRSRLRVVPWRDQVPQGDPVAVLKKLAEEVERVYVHVDLDALNPSVGSGVVDEAVPGGLSPGQLADLLHRVVEGFTVVGATIATYTPANDDGSTLPVALHALRILVGCDR